MSLLLRFLIGGIVVSAFASLADLLKPKTFAGLFGAAPSVALASVALTVSHDGRAFALEETRSMIAGAIAFFLYAIVCIHLMTRFKWSPLKAASTAMFVWFASSFFILFLLRPR